METEGVSFERRVGTILPVIEKEIDPENFKDVSNLPKNKTCANFCSFTWGGIANRLNIICVQKMLLMKARM